MLPEITFLEEGTNFEVEGHVMNPPAFASQSVLTLAAVALAEPTFFGEVFLAGFTAVVAVVYVVQLTDYYLNSLQHRQHCIETYVQCTDNKPWLPCGDCLQFCNTQGHWDFDRCPNVNQL